MPNLVLGAVKNGLAQNNFCMNNGKQNVGQTPHFCPLWDAYCQYALANIFLLVSVASWDEESKWSLGSERDGLGGDRAVDVVNLNK